MRYTVSRHSELADFGHREYERAHYASIRLYTSIFPWGGRQMQCMGDRRTMSGREGGIQDRQPAAVEDVGMEGSSSHG